MVLQAPEITPDQVGRWLLDCGLHSKESPVQCVVNGPVFVTRNSRSFYARASAVSVPLLVKVCLVPKTSNPDPETALRQYKALSRVWDAMRHFEEFSVPRPYHVQAEAGMLAMEWISGTPMTDLLISWASNYGRACGLLRQAGLWLRQFHSCHPLTDGRLFVNDQLSFITQVKNSRAATHGVFLNAIQALREYAPALASLNFGRSWIHGDFKSDNLIIAASRTVGIDIHLRNENAVIYDLASFLNHLEMSLYSPKGWRLAPYRKVLDEAFLTAYMGPKRGAVDIAVAWVRLYMLVGAWSRDPSKGLLRRGFNETCQRQVASRLVAFMKDRLGTNQRS